MNSESSVKKSKKKKQLSKREITEKLIAAIKALADAIQDVETDDVKRFETNLGRATGFVHAVAEMEDGSGPGI